MKPHRNQYGSETLLKDFWILCSFLGSKLILNKCVQENVGCGHMQRPERQHQVPYLLVTWWGVSWTPWRRVVDTAGVVVVGHLHLVVVHLLFVCSVAFHRSVGYLSFSITSCLLSGLFQAPLEAVLGCCLLTGFRQPVPFFHRSH